MKKEIFFKIDNNFLIRKNLPNQLLNATFKFIANQKTINKITIKDNYEKKRVEIIKILKNISTTEIDIILKTKFNHDYKFINLKKKLIFNYHQKKINFFLKKINKYNLNKINFFPKIWKKNNIIYQQLAFGVCYKPNNLSISDTLLLQNISRVISFLSLKNKSEIIIKNYINKSKLLIINKNDILNSKIICTYLDKVKKNYEKKIMIAQTHGDFKFEHLFTIKGRLEYVIDWENFNLRSIFFDLFNFFIPWFVKRSYNSSDIKNYILKFVKNYLPQLYNEIIEKYDIYFSLFVLERYVRVFNARSNKFDIKKGLIRFNILFKKFI
jgi:hypothetical protein